MRIGRFRLCELHQPVHRTGCRSDNQPCVRVPRRLPLQQGFPNRVFSRGLRRKWQAYFVGRQELLCNKRNRRRSASNQIGSDFSTYHSAVGITHANLPVRRHSLRHLLPLSTCGEIVGGEVYYYDFPRYSLPLLPVEVLYSIGYVVRATTESFPFRCRRAYCR